VKIKGPKHSKIGKVSVEMKSKKPNYNPIKNLKKYAHPKKKGY
jgi:hypothetical protein